MAKEPRGREQRKPAQPAPELPHSLGRLRMPRKTNRKAAKLIEGGVKLWDRRAANRRAMREGLRNAEGREANRMYYRTVNSYLRNLVNAASGWRLGEDRQGIIEPDPRVTLSFDERFVNLLEAAKVVPLDSSGSDRLLFFRVAELTHPEHVDLRAVLPEGIFSTYSYSDRSMELEDGKYFLRLTRYDPREKGPFTDDDGVVRGTGAHDSSGRNLKGRLVAH